MNERSLHRRLQTLKLRLLAIVVGTSIGWGLVAGIGLVLLCMWLDLALELSPALRLTCAIGSLAAGFLLLCKIAIGAHPQGAPGALARRLDRAAGAHGEILAGVDLLYASGGAAAAVAPITAALARMAVDRAAHLAEKTSAPAAAPAKPIFPPLGILTCVLMAAAIVALSMPRMASTQWARFTDPFGDHPPFSRTELVVSPGTTNVIYGAALDIRATAHGQTIDNLDLIVKTNGVKNEEKLPMFPEPGGTWRATLTNLTTPGRYFVQAQGARSKRFEIGIITAPKLEAVRFRITPPAYTNRPPLEGPLPQGGLAALPGTLVQVWAKSNRPLSAGTMTTDMPQSVAATAGAVPTTQPAGASDFALRPSGAGANEVTGSFVVKSAGKLSLKVADVDGTASTDSYTAPVTLLRDERPFVRILDPKPDSFATPDITLNIEIMAEDDYGISRLELFRGLNESRVRSTPIATTKPEPTRLPVSVPLPLSQYAVSPGDVIKLYARVEDNDPAGAKGSESPIVTVKIISNEQMQQMMLAREGLETLLSKYADAQRRLEAASDQIDKLLKALEKADPNSEIAKEMRDELKKSAEQMGKDAEQLAGLAAQDLPFDLDHALKKQLDAATQSLEKTAEQLKTAAGKPGLSAGAAGQMLAEAKKSLGVEREQFKEEAADPLDHLAKVYPLIEDQARYVELWQSQKDLAERMKALVGHDNEDDPKVKARMRDLETEQRALHQELRDLLDDIENKAAGLPADPALDGLRESSLDFANAVRKSTAADEMAAAESGLEEFAGSRSQLAAGVAADTLEQFISKCQGMGDQAGACLKFQPKLSAGLGDTVQQLLEAAGLGSKPGKGMGNGGGYSARRSSLRNVGLYGRIPQRGKESHAGGGHADHGASSSSNGESVPGSNGAGNSNGHLNASGQSDAAVPDRYKRRVGEYFQRVSDELEQK